MLLVASAISRRKLNKPAISVSIAATKSSAMVPDRSTPIIDPTNSVAMTTQTNSAQTVHRLIDQWISRPGG